MSAKTGFLRVALICALSLVVVVAAFNYFLVQRPLNVSVSSDPRNVGIKAHAHFKYYVVPTTLVFDLREVSGSNSAADVTRVLLGFAESVKDKSFKEVVLSYRGTSKFMLRGDYFQRLGKEREFQNPVYTMRTFTENVFRLDGSRAYGSWSGGLLGVLNGQLGDFSKFHKEWYANEVAREFSR